MFLNGELEEEVYVEQSQWYVIKEDEEKVYKLQKVYVDWIRHKKHGTHVLRSILLGTNFKDVLMNTL